MERFWRYDDCAIIGTDHIHDDIAGAVRVYLEKHPPADGQAHSAESPSSVDSGRQPG